MKVGVGPCADPERRENCQVYGRVWNPPLQILEGLGMNVGAGARTGPNPRRNRRVHGRLVTEGDAVCGDLLQIGPNAAMEMWF